MNEWYILQGKPHEYKILRHYLTSKGIEVYDPHFLSQSDGQTKYKPLFPTYMFAHFDVDESWHIILSAPGLIRVLRKGGTPVSIDGNLVEKIKEFMEVINTRSQNLPQCEEVPLERMVAIELKDILERYGAGDMINHSH